MRIAVFGGSFSPPHLGHVWAAREAKRLFHADKLLIIPTSTAPHKPRAESSPAPEERLELTRLAFSGIEGVEVSDIEIERGGTSYTVDTMEQLKAFYPADELILLMGTDMLLCFDTKWRGFKRIIELATLGVFSRQNGQKADLDAACKRLKNKYGARVEQAPFEPMDISSTQIRVLLPQRGGREYLPDAVYAEIIRRRYYGAVPELKWLRETTSEYMDEPRARHARGCEQEAMRLAERWGADPFLAAEAGILHDITKKQKAAEQLKLCENYGIITDNDEKDNYKLLHSKTGAAIARERFGIDDQVYGAILWHTTGRAGMTLLEKVLYIADYIEPNRDFEGLTELRRLAYEDLDEAVTLGLKMSLEDLRQHGKTPHINSLSAYKHMLERN